MKTLASLLLISASLIGTTAYAQDTQTNSTTRAQVVAELQAARAAGQLSVGELDYPIAINQTSSLSRAQVVAELAAAKAAGQLSVGELDYPIASSHPSTVTRAEVVAELYAAKAAGQLVEPEA
ncbi:DUF4148 domain-containing protein [Pollutimonas harenae]|uniref:DUF4148 domain-containing protein n=1 Tax=Pollutimonas harenae TaxID=657015 RepID=A0A853H520_9BURK|nr:DUF4148 domain-containing protein [Pollutimonas harenae]NYT85214.1 DUF4148 domain-containing protein [Pollutimonas harenae]TEA72415.1 DUF4148 domain-containing protein [Pollutimonas harenae]